MKEYSLELSGDERFRLLSVVEAAKSATEGDINDFLREFPWADQGWTIKDLLVDPKQITRVDPDDENMGSDLRGLVYDLRDAREFLALLEGLKGRCEPCGASSEKLYECDKAYLCDACWETWENE
jgi:hypothetical protein